MDKLDLRISKEDKEHIRVLAKQSRMSMSDYVRNKLFNNPLKWIHNDTIQIYWREKWTIIISQAKEEKENKCIKPPKDDSIGINGTMQKANKRKSNQMKKKIISTDQKAYDLAVKEYERRMGEVKYLQGVIQNLTGIENANLDNWFPNTEKKFFAFIENKYKRENTLKVSGRKLCELLSINPNPLIDNEDLLSGKLTGLKKPKIEHFSTFAETPEELDKLGVIETFIDAFYGLGEYGTLYPQNIVQGSSGKLSFDHMKQRIVPNADWIKDTPRRIQQVFCSYSTAIT